MDTGQDLYDFAKVLFPICRSITGNGVRQTLRLIKEKLPGLEVYEVPSGTKAFDWTVPDEWNVKDAWIEGPDSTFFAEFRKSNLHLVGYSEPASKFVTLAELNEHLHSLPEQPDAIPYVTSYYRRTWGFCLPHRQREQLKEGIYHVCIGSTLAPGHLTYADLVIPGESAKEVMLSTYVCHPSLGNNEVSGPVVTTALAQWIAGLPRRRFTYRIVFVPETIGSLVYMSQTNPDSFVREPRFHHLKARVVAGFNVTCVGDDKAYSFLPSRGRYTLAERVALHVLRKSCVHWLWYDWGARGSDERQYCAPGIDLPICSVMRSKYATYPEYHTSLDNLDFISPEGLFGGYSILKRCIEVLEIDRSYVATVLGEPQLEPRGLFDQNAQLRLDILTWCDGKHSVVDIAEILGRPAWEIAPFFDELHRHELIKGPLQPWPT